MKTIITAALILLTLAACEKKHEMRCIECDKLTPDGKVNTSAYVPGYCGTDEMVQDCLNYMNSQKWSYDQPMYKCWEVEP